MTRNLISSFGSKSILESIKKKNSDRKMIILSNTSENDSFQLVDFSDRENIFQSPNRYQVLFESGFSITGNLFRFDFFELSDDSLKAFDQKIQNWANSNADSYDLQNSFLLNPLDGKPSNRALLTIWNQESNRSTFEVRDLQNIIAPYTNQNYFRTIYQVVN
ncbi:hypothetical protein [Pediococcus stilesii]|uniref:Monooxygenase n=1 Tax=Pediococcus stilesii TaxID=331679 RepID=A0A0R2L134_9LACO|nr:hypothetical protein [Pediococcus stilesii]KRN93148.1 monooxygenase [Pediococcus stilesii]